MVDKPMKLLHAIVVAVTAFVLVLSFFVPIPYLQAWPAASFPMQVAHRVLIFVFVLVDYFILYRIVTASLSEFREGYRR